jgi:hypothetical protein
VEYLRNINWQRRIELLGEAIVVDVFTNPSLNADLRIEKLAASHVTCGSEHLCYSVLPIDNDCSAAGTGHVGGCCAGRRSGSGG